METGGRMMRLIHVLISLILMICLLMQEMPVSAETSVSAKACILIEAATGQVLFQKNAEEKSVQSLPQRQSRKKKKDPCYII